MWLFLMCAFRATAVDVSALNGWLPIQAKEHQFTSVHQRNEVGAQINRKIRLPFTFTWEIRLELPDMACQLYIIGKTLQSLPLTFVGHSLTLTVKPPGDAEPIGSCVDIPSHSGIAHVHTGSYRPTSGQSHWTIPSIPLSLPMILHVLKDSGSVWIMYPGPYDITMSLLWQLTHSFSDSPSVSIWVRVLEKVYVLLQPSANSTILNDYP